MRSDVERDWQWSDGFLPEVFRILAENGLSFFVVRVGSYKQDVEEATDVLIEITGGEQAIAVRVRTDDTKYRDLTIRSNRASGVETELAKIKAGRGDYFFYGWAQGKKIPEWMIVDLQRLRESGLLETARPIRNPDGKTSFIPISYQTLLEHECIVNAVVFAKELS